MEGKVMTLGNRQESGLAKYAVNIEHSQGVGVIGAGITGNIRRAWVEYGGEEVTEVPEGENFVVKASITASNPGAYTWSLSLSAVSTDREIGDADSTNILPGLPFPDELHVGLGPMPAHDITLRIKLWGNQELWTDPGVPDKPPESEW